jgi:single-strand DNA-binding protein
MVGVNKVILIGNLGRDPEIVSFDQVKKATFSLATTEIHKCKDGSKVEETEWHNIVCWRGLADIAERFLKKGMQIYVEGRIRSRIREDKDGGRRRLVEIIAENFEILNRPFNANAAVSEISAQNSEPIYGEIVSERFGNPDKEADSNLSKLLSEDTDIEKLGDLPF